MIRKSGYRFSEKIMRKKSRVLSIRRDLPGEHLPRRLDVDQGIDVELGRNDIGPFVEDAVKHFVAVDVEDGHRAAADARVDVLADTRSFIPGDPWPEALALRCKLGGSFGSRGRNDEKPCGHDPSLLKIRPARSPCRSATARCRRASGAPRRRAGR